MNSSKFLDLTSRIEESFCSPLSRGSHEVKVIDDFSNAANDGIVRMFG